MVKKEMSILPPFWSVYHPLEIWDVLIIPLALFWMMAEFHISPSVVTVWQWVVCWRTGFDQFVWNQLAVSLVSFGNRQWVTEIFPAKLFRQGLCSAMIHNQLYNEMIRCEGERLSKFCYYIDSALLGIELCLQIISWFPAQTVSIIFFSLKEGLFTIREPYLVIA